MENKKMDQSQQQAGQDRPKSGGHLEERLRREEGPAKPHGDALQHGSGTRHGVDEADERPES